MRRDHVSCKWLTLNIGCGMSRDAAKILASHIPSIEVFEACRRGEITSAQGAELLELADEERTPWIVRLWRSL